MRIRDTEHAAVASRAKRRFPDHRLDVAYAVCLPVYELRLKVTEMAEHDLSTAARFILQLANIGIAQPTEIGRLLGLQDSYLSSSAAELLGGSLVVQRPDNGIEVTDSGKEILMAGGRSLRPRNRHPKVPYDPLTKAIADIDIDRLLDRNTVRKEGFFVVPAKPRKPRLSNLRIAEVRDYDQRTRRPQMTEILEIADVKDVRLRYRNDIVLVKLHAPGSERPTFAAYRAQQYLEEVTTAIQRLADGGADLVPDELKTDDASPRVISGSVSNEESNVIAAIRDLHGVVSEKEQAVADARVAEGTTQSARERTALASRIEELEAERGVLVGKLSEREDELDRLTRSEIRLIHTEEHRQVLLDAIAGASSELTLVSAWMNPRAFDLDVCRTIAAAISRGVTVRIAWGMGTKGRRGAEAPRNRVQGENALAGLVRLIPNGLRQRLETKLTETHEKFIICDDLFCAWGSFNWLSYRGERDSQYRRETSLYSERPDDIAIWKSNAASLFGS